MKNQTRSKLVSIVASSAALLFIVFVGIVATVVYRRNRAEAFLNDATALELRRATVADLQQLSVRYGGHIEPSTCDSHGCAYFFSFDNGWLHRLRLAPSTWFSCTLGVADNALAYRRILLTTTRKGLNFGVFVEEWVTYPKGLQFLKDPFDVRLQPKGVSANIRWRVHVNLTADATREEHRIAYSPNLRCLSKIGGCEDAEQMLPSISWNGAGQT